ncbi:MAG: LysM peptidoglycan-binding domain-containing protein [Bacillaceae bacterium]|nr:LysM peptidoglycan-binding domain-containing protein [Bacillaceae bacterium]
MKIHVVKQGENLRKIAKKYNVDAEKLIAVNRHIQDPYKLKPRTKVKIPTEGVPLRPKKAEVQAATVQSRPGDSYDSNADSSADQSNLSDSQDSYWGDMTSSNMDYSGMTSGESWMDDAESPYAHMPGYGMAPYMHQPIMPYAYPSYPNPMAPMMSPYGYENQMPYGMGGENLYPNLYPNVNPYANPNINPYFNPNINPYAYPNANPDMFSPYMYGMNSYHQNPWMPYAGAYTPPMHSMYEHSEMWDSMEDSRFDQEKKKK